MASKRKYFVGQAQNARTYTTFLENKSCPIHRWYFYPEGFSGSFVKECIDKFELKPGETILDPFVGSGTTLVAAKQSGIDSIGIDISPLMCFVSRVKTNWNTTPGDLKNSLISFMGEVRPLLIGVDSKQTLIGFIDDLRSSHKEPQIPPPSYSEIGRYFTPQTLKKLLFLKERILQIENEDIGNLFMLGFASILIDASNMKRMPDLTFSGRRNNVPVAHLFQEKLKQMYEDLAYIRNLPSQQFGNVRILLSDSKNLSPEEIPSGSVDLVLTSPPYVGHGDYVKNTKIELWFLDFIKRTSEMRQLRDSMIISHHRVSKARLKTEPIFRDQELSRVCSEISRKKLWSNTIHLTVQKFFDDLFLSMKQMYRLLAPGKFCIIIIGDSQFGGVHVESHKFLAKIAQRIGFSVEEIALARRRRTGAQRKKVGGVKLGFSLGEYILVLRKRWS